jgi:hypothetical protein
MPSPRRWWSPLLGALHLVCGEWQPVGAQVVDLAEIKTAVRAALLRLPAGKGLVEVDSAGADSLLFRCLRVATDSSLACRATPLPRLLIISRLRVGGEHGDASVAIYSPKKTRDGLDVTELEVRVTRQGSTWLARVERVTVSEAFRDPGEK